MEVATTYMQQPNYIHKHADPMLTQELGSDDMDTHMITRDDKGPINMNNFMDTSPDILLGAYLMSHLRTACENCGTTSTPQWRKGWFSGKLTVMLHKNSFCI